MSFSVYELNLLLIVLLSVASVFIIFLALVIRRIKNERDFAHSKNESDSKILFLKSRYASMGETVGNIAHQWKQPLNAIGSIQTSIKAALIYQGEISKEKLLDSVETSFKLLKHLAETIDTFYSFLSQRNSEEISFAVADELEAIRKITEYSFQNSRIKLEFILDTNPMIQGNPNEFTHALLNLILNAKDAFDNHTCDSPTITVRVSDGNDSCTITISDNAGGIRVEPIDMVFDLHISTKEEGSGLGLFMTKNIIEKRFGGTIVVENKNNGACFTITLPYAEYGEYFSPEAATDEKLTLERINQLTHKIIELEELEKTLRKWADIFKQAHWAIAMHVGKSNTFELTNAAFNALYGYTAQELRDISVPDLFATESLPILSVIQKEAFEKGYVAFESLHKRKDGTTFPVSVELIVVKGDDGEVLYHIANIWDLTEKKAAEERLLLKKFALDHIKDAVFLIDENANFHYVNEGACKALGYSRNELNSMSVADIDPNWPKERWPQHWKDIIEHKTVLMESICQRKDGSVFPIEISSNYFEYNGVGYTLAIVRDMTERLQLEEQKDNERMKLFFERQLVGMAITSPEKGWLHTNEKLQNMLGYTHEELTQLTWAEMTYPEDLAPDIEQFEKLLRGEIEDYMLEKRFIRKDGSIVYTNLAVSCVRSDDRSVNYVLALLEDITERKAAQEALAAKEREFRSLSENIPDNIARWDIDGRYLYINPVQEQLLGVKLTEVIGKRLDEAFPKIDFSTIARAIDQVVKTGEPIQSLRQLVPTKEGTMDIHEINLVPERDANGTIISVLGVGRDMTNIYRLQDELAKREKEFRALADSSPGMMGAYHLRPDGSVCMPYASPNIHELFGITPEEIKDDATPLMALIHPDDTEMVVRTIQESAENMNLWHIEYRIIHPAKGVRWMEGNTMPQPHPDSGVVWYGYVHDITERKELEALLEKERRFLIDAQRVAHTGSWYLDIPNGVLTWSDETYRIFELKKEDIDDLHKTFYEHVHPEDREMVQAPYVETLKTGLSYQVEHRIVMSDGRIKYVIESCEHSYAEDGTPLYSTGTVQDITERKKAEEALQSNRNLLHAILESSPGVITFALDTHYRYIAFDSKHADVMRTIFGTEISIGMNMLDAVSTSADREIAKRSFDRALSGESFIAEEEYGDERISHKYWQIFYSPVRSEMDEIIGLTCFNVDITERRQTEEMIKELNATLEQKVKERTLQLQQSLELNEGVINAIPDLLFEIDIRGKYLNVWAQNPELLATQKELLLGRSVHDVLSKESADTLIDTLKEANINTTSFGKIIKIDLPQGSRYFELSVSKKGSDNTFLVLSRDVTERKEAAEALRLLNATLEEQVVKRTVELQKALEFNEGIINAIPDLLFEIAPDGTYIGVWAQNKDLLAEQKEMLIGKNFKEVLPPNVVITSLQAMKEVDEKGHSLGKSYSMDLPNGKRWFELSITKKKSNGNYIVLSRDITERKTAEEKLHILNTTLEKRIYERTAQLEEAVTKLHKEIMERLEAEKQLQMVESAINSSTEAIYINAPDLSILYVNDGACRMLGYTREELTSMKIIGIDANFSPEQIFKIRDDTVDNKHAIFETKHRTKEGSIIDVEIVGNPFIYEGIEAVISVVKEITERKKLEKTMHIREQYQRTLLDNFPYFVWLKDQDSRLLAANHQYARVAKVESTADLEGKTDFDFFPRELAQKYVDDDQTVMREGLTKNEEEPYADEHGQIHWMETWKSPVWVNGHIVGTVGCSRDITERKKVAEALNESEQCYKEIFENTSDSIYLMEVTEDGRFRNIAANPAFVRSIGIPLEMLVGSYVGDLTDEETTTTVIAKYRRCIEAGVPTEELTELDLPIGRKKFCSTLIPIKDEDGRVYRIIGLAKDITEKDF